MVINKKVILTFIIYFIISYLFIGYLNSNLFVAIHWVEDVTLTDKLREFYVRTFVDNISLALPISLILTYISFKESKRKKY